MAALAQLPLAWRVAPMSLFEHNAAAAFLNDAGLRGSGAPMNLQVVRLGREIVGSGAMMRHFEANTGWLCCIATRKDMRRQGIASSIITYLLLRAKTARLKEVWLETLFWNRRFYEARGFVHVPIDKAPADQRAMRRDKNTMLMMVRL